MIASKGRIAWQQKMGYNLRSYVELAMQGFQRIFDNAMQPLSLTQQKAEKDKRISA
jgi:hypothetical protein